MAFVLISLVSFFTAILTFFSGFGLGTILTPVFMAFFPAGIAVALTGVVHFFNNVFKLMLTGRHIDREVALRFGLPAVLFAFIGAWVLLQITDLPPLFRYTLAGRIFTVYPVKFGVALLLIFFAVIEVVPSLSSIAFGREKLLLGGMLSGFFGGLCGNQGALRSAFLLKAGLSREAFIGTSVAISFFVDLSRLSMYASKFARSGLMDNLGLVACATGSAILGAYLGNKLLKKVTVGFLQKVVAVMLIVFSFALGMGLL